MEKKTIALVGLGLMGGSMALALRQNPNPSHSLLGLDADPDTLMAALKRSAIDQAGGSELLRLADIVILALAPETALAFLREHARAMRSGALVTDISGVKGMIVPQATALCEAAGLTFLGGHPMAGKEKSGFENADPDLFNGASYILTPTASTPQEAIDTMKALAAQLGCTRLTVTTPEHHDRMIAFTSQIPHVLAGAYVQSPCCPYHEGFSAGSYRDVSRVAAVDEHLWSELFCSNREALGDELDTLIAHLQAYREALAAGDRSALENLIRAGRERKDQVG